MSTYPHLTPIERDFIMILHNKGESPAAIVRELGRHRSTIKRELDRNSDGNTYSASQAQARYQQRREACHRPHKLDDPVLHEQVKRLFLQQHWSPEQIQHRLRHEGAAHAISYATIYRGIYAGRFNDPDWVKSGKQRLRHRGKKRRSKGEPTNDNFPVGHELSERPAEAQARARIGDWEADTVAGVVGGAVLVTLTDRKSRFLRCARVEKKTAEHVNAAMIAMLADQVRHSITPDRGKEFARHAAVAEELGVKIYFPPPYQPWQRGTNENTNGLLREYCPKHQDIAQYSDEYIEKAVWALNNRPRKCLQWRTPYEVYFEQALHLV